MDIPVEKLMSAKAFSIEAGKTVRDLAAEMTQKKIGSLLVTKRKEYVGIVTETDVVRKGVSDMIDPGTTTVESIMSSPIVVIESDQSLMEANNLMEEKQIRHLPVTRQGEIVGVLSVRDLLRPIYVD